MIRIIFIVIVTEAKIIVIAFVMNVKRIFSKRTMEGRSIPIISVMKIRSVFVVRLTMMKVSPS